MLTRLRDCIPPGHRKIPMKYYRMTGVIQTHWDLERQRYMLAHPIQTPGVELLRFLILNLDIEDLDSYDSDVARYAEKLKFYKNCFLAAYNPVASKSIAGGKFVLPVNGYVPSEVILDSELNNPTVKYPFDEGWEAWQDIRSIRLLSVDSLELPETFHKSMLEYKTLKPSVVVFSLDVPTLMMKYYKYYKDCQMSDIEPNPNMFLKEYELTDFFDDMFDAWLVNLVDFAFAHPDASTKDIMDELVVHRRYVTENMLVQGIDCLKEYVELAKNGNLRLADFLDTQWFYGGSIREKMAYLDEYVTLPDLKQYRWCEMCEWLPYFRLITHFINLFPDSPQNNEARKRIEQIYIKYLKRENIPSLSGSGALRDLVVSNIEEFKSAF